MYARHTITFEHDQLVPRDFTLLT